MCSSPFSGDSGRGWGRDGRCSRTAGTVRPPLLTLNDTQLAWSDTEPGWSDNRSYRSDSRSGWSDSRSGWSDSRSGWSDSRSIGLERQQIGLERQQIGLERQQIRPALGFSVHSCACTRSRAGARCDPFGIAPSALRDVELHGFAKSRATNSLASSKSPRSKSS